MSVASAVFGAAGPWVWSEGEAEPTAARPARGFSPQSAGDHISVWFLLRARSVNF
jgi:hypothetical protein